MQSVAVLLLLPSFGQAQAQLALSTAFNRTVRNRAMSQRLVKAYCQILLGVLPEESNRTLADTRKKIRAGFVELDKSPLPSELAGRVAELKKQADAADALVVLPPTRESVAALAQQSDKVMLAAQTTAEAFEKVAKVGSAKLINIAGRQRALSQRIARDYFLTAAKLDGKGLRDQMKADATEFRLALDTLAAAPISTPAIRNELELGRGQWLFFESALQRKPDDKALETVATTSERLLEVLEKLTDLYDVALKEVLG
jgi:hypothetical protein